MDHGRAVLLAMLSRVAGGDRDAFGELYQLTSRKLFGVCLRILPEREEAEEVLQDIYLTIWQRAASFDAERGTAMTWLITIARNRALDRLRGKGRIATAPIELAVAVADPSPLASASLEAKQERRRLVDCLDALDAGDARLIRSSFLEGSTYSELAMRAGVPLGTVKSRIRRALLKLRAGLL